MRRTYALSERTLRRFVSEALRNSASSRTKLMELLECRLENVVFRAGFAPTVAAARQLIAQRCIRLNGRVAAIPSRRLRTGDVVSPRPGRCPEMPAGARRPAWIALDEAKREARLTHRPAEADLPLQIDLERLL